MEKIITAPTFLSQKEIYYRQIKFFPDRKKKKKILKELLKRLPWHSTSPL